MDYKKPTQDIIKKILTKEQYDITQNAATERPFANEFWNFYDKGIYVDIVTGEPLFSSINKFESSCGWPAFSTPISKGSIVDKSDNSFGMIRTEVRSNIGNSHMGHVFKNDYESPNGTRYCINSASLRFIPYNSMETEGYGSIKQMFETENTCDEINEKTDDDYGYTEEDGIKVIYLAGGCFWGMEKLYSSLPGVVDVKSGYANGQTENAPSYEQVCLGNTGYRETIRVTYRPLEISLDALIYAFFETVNPTIKNRQGNDIGSQYQSGIYYADNNTKKRVKEIELIEIAKYGDDFSVEIKAIENFYEAEEYHQKYLDKNPLGYCHIPQRKIEDIKNELKSPSLYKFK